MMTQAGTINGPSAARPFPSEHAADVERYPPAEHEQSGDEREREMWFYKIEARAGKCDERKGADTARNRRLLSAEKFFKCKPEEQCEREQDEVIHMPRQISRTEVLRSTASTSRYVLPAKSIDGFVTPYQKRSFLK